MIYNVTVFALFFSFLMMCDRMVIDFEKYALTSNIPYGAKF